RGGCIGSVVPAFHSKVAWPSRRALLPWGAYRFEQISASVVEPRRRKAIFTCRLHFTSSRRQRQCSTSVVGAENVVGRRRNNYRPNGGPRPMNSARSPGVGPPWRRADDVALAHPHGRAC